MQCLRHAGAVQCFQHAGAVAHPGEDGALGFKHGQAHALELREVGAHAIFHHHTLEAPVVGLPHGGVDADLGGHPAHHQGANGAGPQDGFEVGGVEGALARFVDDHLTANGG